MNHFHSRARLPVARVWLLAPLILALAGCSSNRYFMVPKHDLQELGASVQAQRNTLVTMENNASVRHEQLLQQQQTSTQTILEAINRKMKRPACPPPDPARICPPPEDRGRADYLRGKLVVGEVEKVYLADAGQVYTARIDSGAETSSIDARNITRFERDGNQWVRFDVPVPGTNRFISLEKEVVRRVRIVQASAEDPERRIVVTLQFAIGSHRQEAEFTLTDRSELTYEILIGRNILRDVMLVDVGREFATELPQELLEGQGDSL